LARQLEVRVAAAEQARETLLQSGVDAVERILEARARFTVDFADRRLEGLERLGEILELSVEVFLALGLLLELIDRGEIHLTEPLDLAGKLGEAALPFGDIRLWRHFLVDLLQIELRGAELLEQRFAPHLQLLRRQAHVLQAGASLFHGALHLHAPLIQTAHARLGALERIASRAQRLLDLHALRERRLERLSQRFQRGLAVGKLTGELIAPLLKLLELAAQPVQPRSDRSERRAARFDLDGRRLRRFAIALRLRALVAEILTPLVALAFQVDARRLELRHGVQAFLQARTRLGERRRTALVVASQVLQLAADARDALGG